jgi:hypothetical protein
MLGYSHFFVLGALRCVCCFPASFAPVAYTHAAIDFLAVLLLDAKHNHAVNYLERRDSLTESGFRPSSKKAKMQQTSVTMAPDMNMYSRSSKSLINSRSCNET